MSREIPLTQGQVAIVDEEDYEKVNQFKWHAQWSPRTQSYYAVRTTYPNGYKHKALAIRMHSFLMGEMADHKNHDTLDNQKDNLRPTTFLQNGANKQLSRRNTSGYKGVSLERSRAKWKASIMHDGKPKNLGRFDDPLDAAKAYDAAAKELFGEFAHLNFPEGT